VLWTPHFNVPLRSACPLVVTLHDLLPLTAPALAGYGRSLPVRAWLRAIAARARAVLCVSAFTRGELLRLAPVEPERVHVTPLGVDHAWIAAGDATAAEAAQERRAPAACVRGGARPDTAPARPRRAPSRHPQRRP
jgi:hypothetical protein